MFQIVLLYFTNHFHYINEKLFLAPKNRSFNYLLYTLKINTIMIKDFSTLPMNKLLGF